MMWYRALALLLTGAEVGGQSTMDRLSQGYTSEGPPPDLLRLPAPNPGGLQVATFGLGCFWGSQMSFSCATEEVTATQTGYKGGTPPRGGFIPNYGDYSDNGYTEAVLVFYKPTARGATPGAAPTVALAYRGLLDVFWASHDATHVATNVAYRSVIWYHNEEQRALALQVKTHIAYHIAYPRTAARGYEAVRGTRN
jgi:peptide methionine sulfoxide reductase MsrA